VPVRRDVDYLGYVVDVNCKGSGGCRQACGLFSYVDDMTLYT
jgi:hypothetical protein